MVQGLAQEQVAEAKRAQTRQKELQRLGILLNRTREEVAREHVTRAEVRADAQMLLDRLDRLEHKIDRLVSHNAK
jgi:hypothetical protein